MTPEESDALAELVETVDDAGGEIRAVGIEYETSGSPVQAAMAAISGGEPNKSAVFEIRVAPSAYLVDAATDDPVEHEHEEPDDLTAAVEGGDA